MTAASRATVGAPPGVSRHAGRALAVVMILGMLYVARHLDRGWVPSDDGVLAHAAERALRGQLPHRDFDDLYTGGLALWDAAAFRLFGVTLLSLRLALFGVFTLWIPAVFYLATRVCTPVRAAFVTFLAIVWSLPNYNAAMPSWYNLFLATFAIAAVVRSVETGGQRRWLVVAGIAAGLSILVKVVGLYLVAGILLSCVYDEQLAAQADRGEHATGGRGYSIFVTACLTLFVAALALLVRRDLGASELLQFLVPGAALAAFLVRREWALQAGPSAPRMRRLFRTTLPFIAGVTLPVALFLVPYLRSESVPALLNGVFVLPMRRFDIVTRKLPPLYTVLAVLPLLACAWAARRVRRPLRWYEAAALAAFVVVFVRATGTYAPLYRFVWHSVRGLLPPLVLGGLWLLSHPRNADRARPALSRWTFLLLACTAMCSLVQFPFAAPLYFAYVAPLVILSALMVLQYAGPLPPALPRTVLGIYMLFAMFRMNISALTRMGVDHVPFFGTKALALPRAGIRISRGEQAIYDGIVPALVRHARGGATWAGPDLPEIYFLSGLRNPTRALSEMLSTDDLGTDGLLRLLEAQGITAIVLNQNSYYSHPLAPEIQAALERRYPFAEDYGPLQLRWRT